MGPNSGIQEYCLRWNNHHSTLVSVMDALLQKGTLVDVTLAAEGKSIQVHRLVLCACSHYFQVIINLQDFHPLVCLVWLCENFRLDGNLTFE